MVRLIATDLDGTLLNSRGEVSPRNLRAIKTAQESGVIVCIASGRIHATCKPIHDALGLTAPIIAVNGAWVQQGDTVLEHHPLPYELFEEGLALAEKHGACPMAVIRDRMTFLAQYKPFLSPIIGFYEDEVFFEELSTRAELVERVKAHGTERLSFVSFEAGELGELCEELIASYTGRLEVSSSWGNNVEIAQVGISKGSAVGRLAARYGIAPDEVMAIGDHDNDISMLRFAGVSVAMGNSLDPVKQAARYVTSHHDEDGFAEALERYAL